MRRGCPVGPGHCPNEGVIPLPWADGELSWVCVPHAVAYAIPDLGARLEVHLAILAGKEKP